jgi:hypothetical protein
VTGVHHTRVFGGLADCRPWLRTCVKAGFIPDVIFTLGKSYVVATSPTGDLYIRRGPRGIRAVSKDPFLLNRKLHKKALAELRGQMMNLTKPMKTVKWDVGQFRKDGEKSQLTVS